MAIGYYRLIAPAMNAQAVCTLFEAEANVTACTVAGIREETDTSALFPDAIQIATITVDASGGTFNIGVADEFEITAEAATAASIQVALRANSQFSATLTVTGSDGGPFTYTGALTDPTLVVEDIDLTGGASTVVLVDTQSIRSPEVLVFSNQVVFKVVGTTVAAITDAATALIAAEDDAGDSNAGANVEVAGGYPAVAI